MLLFGFLNSYKIGGLNKLGFEIIDTLESAEKIVRQLLAVQAGEKVLLIADTETEMSMLKSVAAVVKSIRAEYVIAIMPSVGFGEGLHTTLPGMLKKALEAADVAIGLNRMTGAPSYDDTLARLLKEKRIRYMSMVMRSLENWTKGAATADYEKVYETAERMAELLRGNVCRVTTQAGTDFTANIQGKRVIIEAGLARMAGQSSAFSDGEVSLGPVEGTTNGLVVVDGPIAYLGMPDEPLRMEMEKGRIVRVEGGKTAEKVREVLKSVPNFDNFAEIGIGVNPRARRSGDWQEEKKGWGNIHIALGDNIYYGGTTKCALHSDFVIYRATVEVDGRIIVEDGDLSYPVFRFS